MHQSQANHERCCQYDPARAENSGCPARRTRSIPRRTVWQRDPKSLKSPFLTGHRGCRAEDCVPDTKVLQHTGGHQGYSQRLSRTANKPAGGVLGHRLTLCFATAQYRRRPGSFMVAHVKEDLNSGVGQKLIR
jgi:hypothetical protein